MVSLGSMTEHKSATPDDSEEIRGPHLWLNWQAMLIGQPARSQSTDSEADIAIRPLWEEHALYSDSTLAGELELGPYEVLITLAGGGEVGLARQQLVLRHRDHLAVAPVEPLPEDAEPDLRGWTGGDIADQMAALLALATARRMRSGGVVRQGFEPGDPLGRPLAMTHRPPELVGPGRVPMLPGVTDRRNIEESAGLLDRYKELDAASAVALTRAAGQYADALWWADGDPRIAWIKLVGALEAAANHWDKSKDGDEPEALLRRHRPRLFKKLEKIDATAVTVVAKDLKGTFKAEAKLLDFTLAHLPPPPPTRPSPAHQIDFDDLEPALRSIYEWRSRDLHDGIPFPWPLCRPPDEVDGYYCERFPASAMQGSGGSWSRDDLPMNLHVFAYIVGGALRRWWAEQAAGS